LNRGRLKAETKEEQDMNIDTTLLNEKVNAYGGEVKSYYAYADLLKNAFERACCRLAIEAVVQSRAKSLPSFAEKVVRKQAKFLADPSYHFTDLCGTRIITQTTTDKTLLCDYLRLRFTIDKANSVDVKSRLKDEAFGYLSMHFVIQIPEGVLELEGLPIPPGVRTGKDGFKAEVQVRTMLEHVWAATLHDRLYKAGIQVPAALKREAASLAATVEKADQRFLSLTQTLDAYVGQYCADLKKERQSAEREVLNAARDALMKKQRGKETASDAAMKKAAAADLGLKLARLARSAGNLDEAISELRQLEGVHCPAQLAIQLELGHALCLKHRDDPKAPEFRLGQQLLQGVAEQKPDLLDPELPSDRSIRAEACRLLAWSHSLLPRAEEQVLKWYARALLFDPDNPYLLTACLCYEAFLRRDQNVPATLHGTVHRTIATCRQHVEVGIEVPRAYFTIGRLHLMLQERTVALRAYLKAIGIMLAPGTSVPDWILDDEVDFLRSVRGGQSLPNDHEIVRRLIELAVAVRANRTAGSRPDMPDATTEGVRVLRDGGRKQVLCIAGGAAGMPAEDVQRYRVLLQQALREFDGIVLSGGTKSGIPGLVGEVAEDLAKQGTGRFSLLGYLPHHLPKDAPKDERYERHGNLIESPGQTLSELDAMQGWMDLVAAGINPSQVRLLGINGGAIAGFEYRLALALGAKVGVVEGSGREADVLLQDPDWKKEDQPGLIPLPLSVLDDATVRAFVRPDMLTMDLVKLDQLAEMAHKRYLAETPYSDVDPVRRKYKDLREDLKESNRQQILYAAEILASEGYEVRQVAEGEPLPPPPHFDPEAIERMAKLEHGRWNVERLAAGWRPGREKDVPARVNPCLATWEDLRKSNPDVLKFDRMAIEQYAALLAKAGFVIIKRGAAQ